jgi:Rod binding domain-containing protein
MPGTEPANCVSLAFPLGSPSLATERPVLGKDTKAARDFEAILLTSLLDSLQKTFCGDAQDSAPGASDYRLMGTEALASAVAAGGGIGIARLILNHLPASKVPGNDERGSAPKG